MSFAPGCGHGPFLIPWECSAPETPIVFGQYIDQVELTLNTCRAYLEACRLNMPDPLIGYIMAEPRLTFGWFDGWEPLVFFLYMDLIVNKILPFWLSRLNWVKFATFTLTPVCQGWCSCWHACRWTTFFWTKWYRAPADNPMLSHVAIDMFCCDMLWMIICLFYMFCISVGFLV